MAALRQRVKRRIGAYLYSALRPYISQEIDRVSQQIPRTPPDVSDQIQRAINAREMYHLTQSFHIWNARSPGDMLSDWEIECFAGASQSVPGDPAKAEEYRGALQSLSIPLFEKVIGDAKSVLEVGVAVGYMLHLMAKAHPEVQFTGIDFWGNVVELNKPLLLPNFKVMQGYALPMMEAGLTGDIVHFGSTAARIKQAELKRYLRSIPKYVIINEPLFKLPDGTFPDPDTVGASIPMLVYPVYAGDRYGGLPPCLCHNYKALVEEAGFDVLHYEKVYDESRVGTTPRVMLVGKRRT